MTTAKFDGLLVMITLIAFFSLLLFFGFGCSNLTSRDQVVPPVTQDEQSLLDFVEDKLVKKQFRNITQIYLQSLASKNNNLTIYSARIDISHHIIENCSVFLLEINPREFLSGAQNDLINLFVFNGRSGEEPKHFILTTITPSVDNHAIETRLLRNPMNNNDSSRNLSFKLSDTFAEFSDKNGISHRIWRPVGIERP